MSLRTSARKAPTAQTLVITTYPSLRCSLSITTRGSRQWQSNLLTIIKSSMEDTKQKNSPWLSVPQFGDWDMKNGQVPDYSLDFSKIRENRKQNKRDVSRTSIGKDEDLVPSKNAVSVPVATTDASINHCRESKQSPSTRRSIFSYFNCCAKAPRQ